MIFGVRTVTFYKAHRWVNPQANSSDAEEAEAESDAHSGPRV